MVYAFVNKYSGLRQTELLLFILEKGFAGLLSNKAFPFSYTLELYCHFNPNTAFSPKSTPLNPINAKDSNPAAISTIGMPLMLLGILT